MYIENLPKAFVCPWKKNFFGCSQRDEHQKDFYELYEINKDLGIAFRWWVHGYFLANRMLWDTDTLKSHLGNPIF